MTDEKKRRIFEEIAHILETPRQAEDEITVKEYAEFSKCTTRPAYSKLMKAVIDGKMEKRKVLIDRNWAWAFRRVEDEEIAHCSSDTM